MRSLQHTARALLSRGFAPVLLAAAGFLIAPTPARADHAPNPCFPPDLRPLPEPDENGIFPGIYLVLFRAELSDFCGIVREVHGRVGGTLLRSSPFAHRIQWGDLSDPQLTLLSQEPTVVAVEPLMAGSGGGPGTTVPEPMTVALLGAGLTVIGGARVLRRRALALDGDTTA